MIKKPLTQQPTTCVYNLIPEILNAEKDYYLTKEDIYVRLPKDDDGMPLITISSFENALSALCRSSVVEFVYIRGVRHFTIGERY